MDNSEEPKKGIPGWLKIVGGLFVLGLLVKGVEYITTTPEERARQEQQQATEKVQADQQQAAQQEQADRDKWRDDNLLVAKYQVLKVLKDPDSAQFRDMTVVAPTKINKNQTGIVCGEVNSKNSFGGYTGFHPFIVISAIPMVQGEDNYSTFRRLWNRECASKPMLP